MARQRCVAGNSYSDWMANGVALALTLRKRRGYHLGQDDCTNESSANPFRFFPHVSSQDLHHTESSRNPESTNCICIYTLQPYTKVPEKAKPQQQPIKPTMSSTSNNTGATSDSRPKILPRDDSKEAKKAEARKTQSLERISLGQFLKESEEEGGIGADGVGDGDTAGKDGGSKDDGGKKSGSVE
ncbi:hypothetical protein P171DRAFT_524616 [Karstenula rhodostoma CBS 690.94]|uniref:Uncharacterized protein n=1 Tax=Karstenula rhodostoma CBS 690.94 TaxID=1392251 RepID=A0A9P4U7X5_9PLEO|nr:hypothetical protein P171DRAFT_524616 [Karstenula rhodostoma CBS 690.94]